jgi:hypothetical protein
MDPDFVMLTLINGSLELRPLGGNNRNLVRVVGGNKSRKSLEDDVNGEQPIHLTGKQLALLAYTTDAASSDEDRVNLTSLFLTAEGSAITAACADGFMLAECRLTIPDAGKLQKAYPDAEMLLQVGEDLPGVLLLAAQNILG